MKTIKATTFTREPSPLAASPVREAQRKQAMIDRGLDGATFQRILGLMRRGLREKDNELALLKSIEAHETAAKMEIELRDDRLLVMGWICAAEALGWGEQEIDDPIT